MIGEVFTVICALLGIIGLIFLTYFAAKWLNKRFNSGSFGGGQRSVRIIECVGIAQDKQLMIISVGNKFMLLGVTQNSINKICDLDENDLETEDTNAIRTESGFMKSLKKAFAEKNIASEDPDSSEAKEEFRNEKDDF